MPLGGSSRVQEAPSASEQPRHRCGLAKWQTRAAARRRSLVWLFGKAQTAAAMQCTADCEKRLRAQQREVVVWVDVVEREDEVHQRLAAAAGWDRGDVSILVKAQGSKTALLCSVRMRYTSVLRLRHICWGRGRRSEYGTSARMRHASGCAVKAAPLRCRAARGWGTPTSIGQCEDEAPPPAACGCSVTRQHRNRASWERGLRPVLPLASSQHRNRTSWE